MNSFFPDSNLLRQKGESRVNFAIWVFQENKASQIFQETNISYPLIRIRTGAYQGVKNVRFTENLAGFVFLKHPFWDSPFCLITDELVLIKCHLCVFMTKNDFPYDVELDLFKCLWFYPNDNQSVKKGDLKLPYKQIAFSLRSAFCGSFKSPFFNSVIELCGRFCTLTILFPMLYFYTPWTQKTLQFSGVFRGYRNIRLGTNGLTLPALLEWWEYSHHGNSVETSSVDAVKGLSPNFACNIKRIKAN